MTTPSFSASPPPHDTHAGTAPWFSRATALRLALAWAVVGIFHVFGQAWLGGTHSPASAATSFIVLFGTILVASFGVVHEADHLAHRLGEPYGTLILTLSIVVIEVILIASVLLGPGHNPTIGRDSIFAVMMIIMNLVMGICLLAGGLRHGEQEFNAQGTSAYVALIALLTGIGLVLPNYTAGAGEFTAWQAVFMAALTAVVYAIFLTLQMRGSRRLFVQPRTGEMTISHARYAEQARQARSQPRAAGRDVLLRSLVLVAMVLPIILLAHHLAVVIDYGIGAAGAPVALGGVLIAIIVFTPESITAVRAARNNEMQRAINLCLGAFVSTVGLTVPVILVIGLVTGKQVIMGISAVETVLLAVTVTVAMMTFNGQRTSPIMGIVHIAVFVTFGFLLFSP